VDTALYYTFSTIAQALAAAMAILAAFAMYRLQGIDDESRDASILIEGLTGGGDYLRRYSYLSQWTKCLEIASARIEAWHANKDEVFAIRDQLRQLRLAAAAIRRALWPALGATAVVMAGSVVVLTYVPAICRAGGAQQALCSGVVGFAACLLLYGRLIWQAFRFSKE
jgi:hypothetical protein